MPLYIDDKIIRNTEEQVKANLEELKKVREDINKFDVEKLEEINNKANSAYSLAESADSKSTRSLSLLSQCFEIETLTKTIKPLDWENNEVILENEIFDRNYIIQISATADSTANTNNSYNISYYKVRPLEQTENEKIKIICDSVPAYDIYIDFVILIPLVNGGE